MKELTIIQTKQGMVAVSDEPIKGGDYVYNEISKEIYRITIKEEVVNYEKKIIATDSTFKLEGVPQFEVEKDEATKYAFESLKNKWQHLYTFGNPHKPYPRNFEDEFNHIVIGYKAAQSKYRFTEEDVRKAYLLGFDELNYINPEDKIQQLLSKLTKPKQLKSIVVDSLDEVNGVVKPLKYNYE